MKEIYYSVEQIAQMLNIHPKTIQRYIREGKINAVKLGKSWRVSGHDLSRFTEGTTGQEENQTVPTGNVTARVSAVIDIEAGGRERAVQIMNGITALMNSKPQDSETCTMHAQVLEPSYTVRVTLWGGITEISVILNSLRAYTEQEAV